MAEYNNLGEYLDQVDSIEGDTPVFKSSVQLSSKHYTRLYNVEECEDGRLKVRPVDRRGKSVLERGVTVFKRGHLQDIVVDISPSTFCQQS